MCVHGRCKLQRYGACTYASVQVQGEEGAGLHATAVRHVPRSAIAPKCNTLASPKRQEYQQEEDVPALPILHHPLHCTTSQLSLRSSELGDELEATC